MRGDWEPVESFGTTDRGDGPLDRVDAALVDASVECRRFQRAKGGRAIVVSGRELTDQGLATLDLPGDVADVLFVEPSSSEIVNSFFLSWARAASLIAALPDGAETFGLIPSGGRVVVHTVSGPTSFRLYRRGAPGPKLGESSDVLEQRSKWFETRHGDSE
ncbi:hypothetical protein CBI38_34140 (plasmid) [Rhodococcus oxybenzonivorans]|uniref:Uncharacterized protein n=1 Tax=Rhodococcus oxybenzonivorans TaxID=1990687 RepID=A0A2S2C6E7_9NOCA|nr:hypothetical protein [Rhodococcus oxybenzonivorans]AWK76446.1 hypothetical protein CBI38_34140 [Rhodococcus oxybenzonivorans]